MQTNAIRERVRFQDKATKFHVTCTHGENLAVSPYKTERDGFVWDILPVNPQKTERTAKLKSPLIISLASPHVYLHNITASIRLQDCYNAVSQGIRLDSKQG